MNNEKITTVVFDLDGTLLDTLADLAASVNYALGRYGYPLRTADQVRRALGNGVQRLMEASVPAGLSAAQFAEVFDCFKRHYVEHSMDTTQPYEGIIPLLTTLKVAGYRLAIVSNKMNAAVQELRTHFFADIIEVAIGESATVRRKPAPDTVMEALRALGSHKEEAVYVGDSEVDLATARNAELECLSVTWGFRDETYLRNLGARHLMHRPADVAQWLTERNAR